MKQQNIWVGEKDLKGDEQFSESLKQELVMPYQNEEVAENLQSNRRDFLKYLGFGVGAAAVAAGCDIPVKTAIPYVIKPESIVPGVATYYASTYVDGGDSCPVLVKTREGRPIKIEGNDLSEATHGGTSARVQASVLSLYDTNRFKKPMMRDGETFGAISWEDLDKAVGSKLAAAKNIRILGNTNLSPSSKAVVDAFKAKYPSTKVMTYDSVSSVGILEANEQSFGVRAIPNYDFSKADVIVSFNADFLGTWISPVEYANQYAKGRKLTDMNNPKMSRHVQVESHMSMTGSNADNRILVKPSEMGSAIAHLYKAVVGGISVPPLNNSAQKAITALANQLKNARGKSLVVSGSNNASEQILVNGINNALGNYGSTLSLAGASNARQGNERELETLLSEMKSGMVDALLVMNCNPAYDYYKGAEFKEALSKVGTSVALSYGPDETSSNCAYIAPINHYLESWGDVEAKKGTLCMMQPTISTLFDTRQAETSLLRWSGNDQNYMDFMKARMSAAASSAGFASGNSFWDNALHDGIVNTGNGGSAGSFNADVSLAANRISKPSNKELEIVFYEPISVGNGSGAGNPWLQEMPDPVSRTSWGNYLAVPVDFDGVKTFNGLNGLKDGDLVDLTIGGTSYTVPVIQQFGMQKNTIALALGYGRTIGGPSAVGVGVNINPHVTVDSGIVNYYNTEVELGRSKGKEEDFSCVQYHHTYGVTAPNEEGETINADEEALGYAYGLSGYQGALTDRSVIYNTNVKDLKDSIAHLKEKRSEAEHLNQNTMYPYDEYTEDKYSQGHHWGMHVDLNACIGCGACTVACMAENNVPVVGKREVGRHHEMTWLRIDRYYYGDVNNPNVVYQPMMCQHCDNAPCENVCPVNATNHSSEGLNQMAYNRCVGTRYCANNCPYKVRRFNWMDYTTADLFPANQVSINGEEVPFGADNLTRMVLNPDVTVRSRGVIEKCSFCVQRLQEGKLSAKKEGRALMDADVRSACQTACPTGAIVMGDFNNKGGELVKRMKSPLTYIALEEVNTRSSVNYTMKVNNRDEALDA